MYTEKIKETIDFYCNNLNFTCQAYDQEYGWANLLKDDVEIMLSLPNEHLPFDRPSFTGSIYIKTDGVESLWEKVKDKLTVTYPLESFDYGMKEFAIADNNGYLLQFAEEII